MKLGSITKFIVNVECAIESEGKFLFIQRPPGVHAEGLLSFPGGKFELEDANDHQDVLVQAIKREVYEEVGLHLTGPIRYVTSSCFEDSKNKSNIVVDLIYHHQMDKIPERLRASAREVVEYKWLTIEECKQESNCPEWLIKHLKCIMSVTTGN